MEYVSMVIVLLVGGLQGVQYGPLRHQWYSAWFEAASLGVGLVTAVPAVVLSAWLFQAGHPWWALVPVALPLGGFWCQERLARADRVRDERWQESHQSLPL